MESFASTDTQRLQWRQGVELLRLVKSVVVGRRSFTEQVSDKFRCHAVRNGMIEVDAEGHYPGGSGYHTGLVVEVDSRKRSFSVAAAHVEVVLLSARPLVEAR
jgi:hypothetical protein